MAKSSLMSLGICLFVLYLGCVAQAKIRQQQQNQCQLERLNAVQPNHKIQSEGGITEHWDDNDQQFQCAGVAATRYTIQPRGLLLPHYTQEHQISYIVQGRGIQGIVVPGCPETYEVPQSQSGGESRSQRFIQGDRHQKIKDLRKGDALATPQGVANWFYNDGERPLVIITVVNRNSQENQLDQNRREFYLAGNPQQRQQQGRQGEQQQEGQQGRQEGQQQQGRQGEQEGEQGRQGEQEQEGQQQQGRQGEQEGQKQQGRHGRQGEQQQQGRQGEQEGQQGRQGEQEQEGQQQQGRQGEQEGQQQQGRRGRQGEQEQEGFPSYNNIFQGFDDRVLAEVFGVRVETVRKLKSQNDRRGNIVLVEHGLRIIRPPRSEQEEQEQQGRKGQQQQVMGANGIEETFCTMRYRENIGEPIRADVYTPQGGRLRSINSLTLPILKYLQLSAEMGVLYKNALMAPYWNMNANSVIYVTKGEGLVQVVGTSQRPVFSGRVREGQILVVPQNFAVFKQAGSNGFEWVAFKTNDNAMTTPVAGKTSALTAIPLDVLVNAYQGLSREEAMNLKNNRRRETQIFSPYSQEQEGREYA